MSIDPLKLAAAWRFSAQHHETVYLRHLGTVSMEMGVALELEPAPDAELSMMCAVLQDTIEDTRVTREDLAERFGESVAAGVGALSKRSRHPDAMADSLARIRRQPKAVWKVKLANRVANLAPPPPHWNREKCAAYLAQSQQEICPDQLWRQHV
jgi:(p)ppGpp synthase/HD superfamily hydrolase